MTESELASETPELTVLFDGYCGFCTRCAEFGRRIDKHFRVRFLAHQAPGVRSQFGITEAQADYQIWAIDARGGVRGGAQAAAAILDAALGLGRDRHAQRRLQYGKSGILERIAGLPVLEQGLDRAYQWVARNRSRFPGTAPWCHSHPDSCGV